MKNENSYKVLCLLIKQLSIPVTKSSILTEFQKHPDAGSLLAFSDLLDGWNIPNAAYQVSLQELSDLEIPLPFIACFRKSEYVLVTGMNEQGFVVSNDRWKNHVLSKDEFRISYKGSVLAFQKDENSGETEYASKKRKELIERIRVPFLVIGVFMLIGIYAVINPMYYQAVNWHTGILLMLKLLGLFVTALLLTQSIDANSPLIKKVCGSDSNKNCNAILSSNAAKVFDGLSWSEIGFFYFSGSLLALIFNNHNINFLRILAILNALCLPYTAYSIYYQWRIARQWCIFCCSVLAIHWLEFLAFLPYLPHHKLVADGYNIGCLVLSFAIPILIWVFIKPHLMNTMQLQILKPELYQYKYNKHLFQTMLNQENKYALASENSTIFIGNESAANTLTLVSNPFCAHCSKAHHLLDDLLDVRDDIKLQLVFVNRRYRKELDQKVIGHFMALKHHSDPVIIKKAINDWYGQEKKAFESWSEKYPVTASGKEPEALLRQQEWSNMVNITSTPTIFINGRKLPSVYQPEDIRYIL